MRKQSAIKYRLLGLKKVILMRIWCQHHEKAISHQISTFGIEKSYFNENLMSSSWESNQPSNIDFWDWKKVILMRIWCHHHEKAISHQKSTFGIEKSYFNEKSDVNIMRKQSAIKYRLLGLEKSYFNENLMSTSWESNQPSKIDFWDWKKVILMRIWCQHHEKAISHQKSTFGIGKKLF